MVHTTRCRRIKWFCVSDLLVFALRALPGLQGVALQEDLQLGRITVGGDNKVSHLMKTRVGAVTVIDTNDKLALTQSTCYET